jgi:asparagine synthase (glutamine-hydrolysing)
MLAYDWKFTLADNDLRKVTRMCQAAGIEVSFPMLDNSVVDLSLQIPSRIKIRRLKLRSFYKDAMRGFLPDSILTKSKHGFGLPFGTWLKSSEALSEYVYATLSDVKKREIVSPSFIDRIIGEHRGGHANYYGYMIWDLVMMEMWFKHHLDHATMRSDKINRIQSNA